MILTNINSFIKAQKLLFIIFILLQILAVVSTQYAYLGVLKQENDRLIYVEEATLFTVEFNEPITITSIKPIINKTLEDYPKKLTAISVDITDGNLRAFFFGQNKVVNYGSENAKNSDIIASTNKDVSNGVGLGDKFKSNTAEFNVVGLRTDAPYNEILITAVNDNFKISAVNIVLSFLPTVTEKEVFCEYLENSFSDATIIEPVNRNMHNESQFSSKMTLTISLLLLTVINIVFVFRYVIYKREKIYKISRLCGATKKYIFITTFTEHLIYNLISTVFATLITIFVIVPVFYQKMYFSFTSIIAPAIVFLIMCICITLPLLIKNCNLNMLKKGR